jgi:histidinol dehydrogenase
MSWLKPTAIAELTRRPRTAVDSETLAQAATIVEDVRSRGEMAVRAHAERLGDRAPGEPLRLERAAMQQALHTLPKPQRSLLEAAAARIRNFARAQRDGLAPLDIAVPGGRAGHRWLPVQTAGAYAPGGRYPLPSSVLMTAIPARVAGVATVCLATPRPTPLMLAAAAIADVDLVLPIGGAQAIAALAFGTLGPRADMIVGPGNRWVTAAKRLLVGEVGIDGLAGPSELLVIADATANPEWLAADLLAQAEHDDDAAVTLLTTCPQLPAKIEAELTRQLASLPTADTARASLRRHGTIALAPSLDAAVGAANAFAPEHLQLCVAEAATIAPQLRAYGSLFVGVRSAEVFGDYGIGPNHVLPTGGTARFAAGLSVLHFLRPSTWLEITDPTAIAADVGAFAELEGLAGHGRAAMLRGALL